MQPKVNHQLRQTESGQSKLEIFTLLKILIRCNNFPSVRGFGVKENGQLAHELILSAEGRKGYGD